MTTPKPKWTYDDFYKKIVDIESRLRKLENKMVNRELDSAQHRKALSTLVDKIESALTESPFPQLQKERLAWADASKDKTMWREVSDAPY